MFDVQPMRADSAPAAVARLRKLAPAPHGDNPAARNRTPI
jgi:hypothetical protein